ncbi:hypothetical protein NDK47_26935 [Brevibacillus ruminantium]|uniref:DUF2569 domain-containing protein n=1 Tax=Brevibacillus ruminantium TaxID=2950604 RepID=A0ABY4WEW3_9BACL|nr:hypothetical protein [Brevibacillus ruminantium]USG65691.1 hypothetical protein NDK47_26935 [Brevibacillus ruminantium]
MKTVLITILKWLFAIVVYHPLMLFFMLSLLLQPLLLFPNIGEILTNGVPAYHFPFFILGLQAFWLYIAMKSRFYGFPYRKLTMLLPLLQMCLYTSLALNVGILALNGWADQAYYSKWVAVVLAILAILGVRLLMSLFYWKYPLVQSPHQTDRVIGR